MYCGLTSPDGSVKRRAWSMAPCPPWLTGSPSSGRARPARIDSPAASAEVSPRVRKRVGVHVPDGFLGGVPQAVGMRQFDAVGVGKQGRVAGPGHAVQLVGDVVVLVPDDQVRIAALVGVVAAAVRVRSVLVIPFDDGVGRNRHRDDVAFAGIVVDDDVDLGGAVAVDDVVRDAVERAVAVAGTVLAPIGMDADRAADVGDDGRRVGRHGRVGDVLVPGIVRGKELLAQQSGHDAIFQLLELQWRMPAHISPGPHLLAAQPPNHLAR